MVVAIQGIGLLRLEVEVDVLVRKTKFFIILADPGKIAINTDKPEWTGTIAGAVALADEFAIVSEIALVDVGDCVPGGSVLETGRGEVEHG